MEIYLEYKDKKSQKFWEITVKGKVATTRWGKLGTVGQTRTKAYDSAKLANEDAIRQGLAKEKKGYDRPSSAKKSSIEKGVSRKEEKESKTAVKAKKNLNKKPRAKAVSIKKLLEKRGFLYPQEKLLKGDLYRALPKKFVDCKSVWEDIRDDIEDYLGTLPNNEAEAFFDKMFNYTSFIDLEEVFVKGCWSWEPKGRKVPFHKTDRLGQHYFGAMYTSRKYPWPMQDDIPYVPVVQIDLDIASGTIGVDVGNGFLQLFEGQFYDPYDWYYLRHIPRKYISVELLTEFPDFTDEQKSEFSEQYIYPDFDGYFGPKSESVAVEAFSKKAFTFNLDLWQITEFENPFEILQENAEGLYQSLEPKIQKFFQLFEKLGTDTKISPVSNSRLFGALAPVQTSAREHDSPIFCSGGLSNLIRAWTDDSRTSIYADGCGAIYLKFNRSGRPEYYFEGSS